MFKTLLLTSVLALAPLLTSTGLHAETTLPGDSVYQLNDLLIDQDGHPFTLAQRLGKPQLVTMFYTACPYMCPLIIDTGQGIDHALSAAEKAKLQVLMVSIDPARDSPIALKAMMVKRKLDPARWTLARTEATSVRKLAALLAIRYRALEGGDFNHTSALILLDSDGRIVARTETMGATPDPDFLAQVKRLLASPSVPAN